MSSGTRFAVRRRGSVPDLCERVLCAAGTVVFSYLSYLDANKLRAVCSLTSEVVAQTALFDKNTLIQSSKLLLWRRCFPFATAVRLRSVGETHTKSSLNALRGVQCLDLHQNRIGDAELNRILAGNIVVEELRLSGNPLTDASFPSNVLPRLRSLDITACNGITDYAFTHWHGIHTLNMTECSQTSITDKAFENLRGIHTLNMRQCRQLTITDKAFENLRRIHTLNISMCTQATITGKAFENLRGIHTLDMSYCSQSTITGKAFENLRGVHTLNMSQCIQKTITDTAFENLRGVHILNMSFCNQSTITNKAFENLRGIRALNISGCTQSAITDAAFESLSGIHTLYMKQCTQFRFTPKAFKNLRGIQTLDTSGILLSAATAQTIGELRVTTHLHNAGKKNKNLKFSNVTCSRECRFT